MSSVPNRSQRHVHRKATTTAKNRARTVAGAAVALALLILYLFGTAGLWALVLIALVAIAAIRGLRKAKQPERQPAQAPLERPRRGRRTHRGLADPLPPIGRRRKAASEELNTLTMEKPATAPPSEPVRPARVAVMPGLANAEKPKPWPEVPPPHYPNARPILAGRVAGTQPAAPVEAPVVLPPEEADEPADVIEMVPLVLVTPAPRAVQALPAPADVIALPAPAPAPVYVDVVVEADVIELPAPVALEPVVEEPVVEAPVVEAPVVRPAPPKAPPLAPIVQVRLVRAPELIPVHMAEPEPEPEPEPEAALELELEPEPEPEPELEPEPAPAPVTPPAPTVATGATDYALPSATMLPEPQHGNATSDDEHLERALLLEHTLKTFGVEARVIDFSPGPAVTRYELQPAPGVRVNKFTQLSDDIALALAAQDIRIEAPIPGKSAVGIEVPNKERQMVPLREVLETPQFEDSPTKLAIALGKDNAGDPVVGDLARMPHLLIAGSTGSGKSVCMNTIICSLLFKAKPDEVKMLMIDPKMVELSIYNGIPHLVAPVITDVRKAAGYLKGAVKEMENRYELFAAAGVRNIQQYNRMVEANPGPDPEHPLQPLPFIVIFIDELADLMMVAPADVEDAICRLAQMARACGMHLVIATQSPRVDVITGLIKANVPSRIAFAVSSQVDSRVIMDAAGAERLLGRGDMLYHPGGLPKPVRAQGAFIDENSVEELVRFVKTQGKPVFTAEEVAVEVESKRGGKGGDDAPASAADAAFPHAVRIVIEHGQASVSILQRRLRCNYNKAVRLIDMMEDRGFVGPHQGSKPREVLISLAQWQEEFSTDEEAEEL